jgi:hypothetical protein
MPRILPTFFREEPEFWLKSSLARCSCFSLRGRSSSSARAGRATPSSNPRCGFERARTRMPSSTPSSKRARSAALRSAGTVPSAWARSIDLRKNVSISPRRSAMSPRSSSSWEATSSAELIRKQPRRSGSLSERSMISSIKRPDGYFRRQRGFETLDARARQAIEIAFQGANEQRALIAEGVIEARTG